MKLSDHRREHMVEVLANLLAVAHHAHAADTHHEIGADWRPAAGRLLQAADHLREHIAAVDDADRLIAALGPDCDLPEPTDGPQPTTSPAPSSAIRPTTSAPAER